MVRRIVAAVLAMGILSGCCGCLKKKPPIRVVEQISVHWVENQGTVNHVYDTPEKMQLILNRLRTLGQRFSVDTDPDTLNATTVTITLLYSDGNQRQYQIKPDRYVRFGEAPWQQASPKLVTALRLLLQSLPEDSST